MSEQRIRAVTIFQRLLLIDLVSRGEIDRSSNVLFAHLGGQPAINAYAALFS